MTTHAKMLFLCTSRCGEVREWTNRHAWKACVPATGPWVRIPPSPPYRTSCVPPALYRCIVLSVGGLTPYVWSELESLDREIGAGPCAIEPCEPRQVRKEATVSSQFCVPQDHLAPLPNDVSREASFVKRPRRNRDTIYEERTTPHGLSSLRP